MTLREFLYETKPRLGELADSFMELTLLAERVIYSPLSPKERDVLKAEASAKRIMEGLMSGSS